MAEPDAFDPTHALDGWRVPAPAPLDLELSSLRRADTARPDEADLRLVVIPAAPLPPEAFDPTHLLDGWYPPEPAPLDLQLKVPPRADRAGLDKAKMTRLKARGYEMVDVEDVEVVDAPPPRPAIVAPVQDAPPPAEPDWQPFLDDGQAPLPPPVFAEASVLEVQPPEPPAAPDPQPTLEPIRLFEEPPAVAEALASGADAAASRFEAETQEPDEPVGLPEAAPAVIEASVPDVKAASPAEADRQPLAEAAGQLDAVVTPDAVEEVVQREDPQPVVVEAVEPEVEAMQAPAEPELPSAATEPATTIDEPLTPAVAETPELDIPRVAPPVEPESPPVDEDVEQPAVALAPVAAKEVAATEAQDLAGAPELHAEAPAVVEAPMPFLRTASDQQPSVEDSEAAEVPLPARAEASAPEVQAASPAEPELGQFAEEIEAPEAEAPSAAAINAPPPDLHAPSPPTELDMQSLIGSIRLPDMKPPAVFETPVLDFQLPPPPPEPDPQRFLDDLALPAVPPQPTAFEAPVLDMAMLAPHVEVDPRLLANWQPLAWMVLARQVASANTEILQTPDGLRVESHAPQWLCAVWPPQPPQAPWLGHWPELATVVGAGTKNEALQALLGELPAEAGLWAADLEPDWGLVAELVLQQDAGLRPAQAQALRELAEAERGARLARLDGGYLADGRVVRRRP